MKIQRNTRISEFSKWSDFVEFSFLPFLNKKEILILILRPAYKAANSAYSPAFKVSDMDAIAWGRIGKT